PADRRLRRRLVPPLQGVRRQGLLPPRRRGGDAPLHAPARRSVEGRRRAAACGGQEEIRRGHAAGRPDRVSRRHHPGADRRADLRRSLPPVARIGAPLVAPRRRRGVRLLFFQVAALRAGAASRLPQCPRWKVKFASSMPWKPFEWFSATLTAWPPRK